MGMGLSCRNKAFFQAPIKLAQPFPAPELRATNFTDTRMYQPFEGITWFMMVSGLPQGSFQNNFRSLQKSGLKMGFVNADPACETTSKKGRSRHRQSFLHRVYVARRGMTMVLEGARSWGWQEGTIGPQDGLVSPAASKGPFDTKNTTGSKSLRR